MQFEIGLVILSFWATSVAAQESSGDTALQPLIACRNVTGPEARLACYESATNALEQKVREKQVRIVDRKDIREAKRSLFGFALPRIDLFSGSRDGPDAREEFTEINSTIASASAIANGRVQLRLADDAVWATTEPLTFTPKAGTKVRIKKGPLGSYFILIAGDRAVRGMRVK